MNDNNRAAYVFDGDNIQRDHDRCQAIGLNDFDDFDAAMQALTNFRYDCRDSPPTNRRSLAMGAEDRDHLLACALTTLALWLPRFRRLPSSDAREVIVPTIHDWLNTPEPWLPYTAGLLPPGATFKLHPDDLTTLTYDPGADPHPMGFCSDDEVYVQGDPWEGKDRSEEPAPAVEGSMAEQLEAWARSLDEVLSLEPGDRYDSMVSAVVAGMGEVADDLRREEAPAPVEEKTRLRRNITIVRHWFEDASLVETRMGSPLSAWIEQVEEEFNECGVDGPEAEGASVLDVDREMEVETHEDGNMTARFTAWLDFEYPDQGQSFNCDADVIQHIFYDEGGVAGEFRLLTHFADDTEVS